MQAAVRMHELKDYFVKFDYQWLYYTPQTDLQKKSSVSMNSKPKIADGLFLLLNLYLISYIGNQIKSLTHSSRKFSLVEKAIRGGRSSPHQETVGKEAKNQSLLLLTDTNLFLTSMVAIHAYLDIVSWYLLAGRYHTSRD